MVGESEVEGVSPLQCSLGSDVASLPQKSPARPDSRGGHGDPTAPSRGGHVDHSAPSRGGHGDPTAPRQECLLTLQAEPVDGSYFRAIYPQATEALGLCLTQSQLLPASGPLHRRLFPRLVTSYPFDFSLNATSWHLSSSYLSGFLGDTLITPIIHPLLLP